MGRRSRIVESSDDDDDSSHAQQPGPRSSEREGASSRAQRASKAKAAAAWQEYVPKKRNAPTKDQKKYAGKPKLTPSKTSPKTKRTSHKHRAPEMPLNTDEDDEELSNVAPPKRRTPDKKRGVEGNGRKAESKHDRASVNSTSPKSEKQRNAKKYKNIESSDDDDETDKESGEEASEDSSEDSSSDSGLEEVEKKGADALGALFDAEAPRWIDGNIQSHAEDDDDPEALDRDRARTRDNSEDDRDHPAAPRTKRSRSQSVPDDDIVSVSPTKKTAGTGVRSSAVCEEDGEEVEEHPSPKKKKKRSKQGAAPVEKEDERRRKEGNGKAKAKAKVSSRRPAEGLVGGGVSRAAKRKYNEDILWADSGREGQSDGKVSSKRSRKLRRSAQASSDSELDSDVDSEDDRIGLVVDPKKPRLSLKEQPPRVQKVAIHAIRELEGQLCLVHAFPESTGDSAVFIRRALANGAKAIGDTALRKLLKNEKQISYAKKLGSIPLQRLSLFRGKVKKTTDNMVRSFFGLTPGDVDKVRLLQDGIGYIYPFDHTTNAFQGDSAYSPRIFEEVLQAHFFSKARSFGWRIVDHFTSSLPDKPDEKEIPAAMLALVSTAIFASIDDYRSSRIVVGEFKTNHFVDAYKQNTEVLTSIKNGAPLAYHDIMHGLFVRVTGSERTGQGPAKSYLDVAAMARRSVAA